MGIYIMVKTTNTDRFNKQRKGKNIVTGDCIFPFKYKGVLHNKCVEGKTGNWCATSVKPTKTSKTWAYCIKGKDKQYESTMVNDDSSSSKKSSSSSKKGDKGRLPLEAPLKEHIHKILAPSVCPPRIRMEITDRLIKNN